MEGATTVVQIFGGSVSVGAGHGPSMKMKKAADNGCNTTTVEVTGIRIAPPDAMA
jgi:hypothetical protein